MSTPAFRSVEDHQRHVADLLASIGTASALRTETIALDQARDRILAAPVHAASPLPPFDNSGMDGYGAGLLSSYGEIEEFAHADLRPLDLAAMATQDYDITHYQPVLFAADSWQQVHDVVGGFFETVDDDGAARLTIR